MENPDLLTQFDTAVGSIKNYLMLFNKSPDLEDFLATRFSALIYANLMSNFFNNLNNKSIKELKLPSGKIGLLKNNFKPIFKEIKKALKFQASLVSEDYYKNFRIELESKFPEFMKFLIEIEDRFNISKLKTYPQLLKMDSKSEIITKPDIEKVITTSIIEHLIKSRKKLPTIEQIRKAFKRFEKSKFLNDLVFQIVTSASYKQSISIALRLHERERKGFERRHYNIWKKPLDLMEVLIGLSLEYGEEKKKKLAINSPITDPKYAALIRIHSRSLIMANEIFTLVRSGFPDGAYARWRSLHELAVISSFLAQEADEVSLRYFEHVAMRVFREAREFQQHCRKIGYKPYSKRQMDYLAKRHDDLVGKYTSDFEYKNGYEWIPREIIKKPTFRALEEKIGLAHYRVYYNKSSNASHGGSAGFEYMGLLEHRRREILLAGPTNYGLTDPLHAAAISLLQITGNLLLIEPDFESIFQSYILSAYSNQIGNEALTIQKEMENEA